MSCVCKERSKKSFWKLVYGGGSEPEKGPSNIFFSSFSKKIRQKKSWLFFFLHVCRFFSKYVSAYTRPCTAGKKVFDKTIFYPVMVKESPRKALREHIFFSFSKKFYKKKGWSKKKNIDKISISLLLHLGSEKVQMLVYVDIKSCNINKLWTVD